MTLGTHAVVGAAIATFFPQHPVLAFAGGFISHFILDSIPHWDYSLSSIENKEASKMDIDMKIGKSFVFDLFKIGFDVSLGIFFALIMFFQKVNLMSLILGAGGAILPDFLQFLYFKIRKQPLTALQKFHLFIHHDKKIYNPYFGIFFQVLIVFIAFFLTNYLHNLL